MTFFIFIFSDYFKLGNNNRLDKCQPLKNTPESYLQQQQQQQKSATPIEQQNISLDSFLEFAIQCCDCLEMIHKYQSKIKGRLFNIKIKIIWY